MAKPLERDATSGKFTETQPVVTSAGAGDAGKLAQLDSSGKFDASAMPVGFGVSTFVANASGNLAAGDAVYVNASSLIARASAATSGNPTIGFVLLSATSGASATMYRSGDNTAVTGLTPGSRYYLSDSTPGGITATPVTGSGKLSQYVGNALSATSLAWNPDDATLLV